MRPSNGLPAVAVAAAIVGLISAARALGLADGVVLAATPASAVALAAGVMLRGPGVLATAAGFGIAGLIWGLGPEAAAADAAAHALAALAGSVAMRTLARQRAAQRIGRTRTNDWLISLVGIAAFAVVVGAGYRIAGLAGAFGGPDEGLALQALALQPLGLLTFGAVLASLREYPAVRGDLRPALAIGALGVLLILALWLLLSMRLEAIGPASVTLLLSAAFSLYVAMQARSLDGAMLSFLASHVVLMILAAEVAPPGEVRFAVAVFALGLLVATCQLVHAVNRDRLDALAEVEARKRELEARVEERTARLREATERAIAADAAKTRFIATVSHEVRTPLTGVLGMASLILAGDPDPQTRRNVEVIRRSGMHLLDVINRLLDFAKLGHANGEMERNAFDLAALVEEVLEEARHLPYAEDVALAADFGPGVAVARIGYRHGLRQVLTNLVGNGAKFTRAGAVTVRVRALQGDRVRIEVADTGPGIPEEALGRIFLPFEQAREAARGTGLGLAICAEVVRRMGGRIGVDSAVGDGSTFWFELDLPVAAADAAPVAAVAHAG